MEFKFLSVVVLLIRSTYASQPTAPKPVEAPLRELVWGELNFLHTTDTHGWLAGHLQEPSYSADWGDYISFATRMREKAEANGQDLLVIDTGDRIEGNGLYDASDPKGEYTFNIIKEQHIDVICSGNHELYKQNSSENEYLVTVPDFKGNYLASNLDIVDPDTGELVPLAPRYRKFNTKVQGLRILAFGFLFDFYGNYNNTVVQPVEKTVEEAWFQDAIRDKEVDLFLVIGHVHLRAPEFQTIFKAIREVRWDMPIQFFGGHSHIRDYKRFDSKAYALESGRFMETIGFQSIDGFKVGEDLSAEATMTFSRRYIDNNLFSFRRHTGLNDTTYPTDLGQNVTKAIQSARAKLDLDKAFGCAEKDLWMSRAEYPGNNSIFTWLGEKVLPDMVEDPSRANNSRLIIVNTGGIRFDILRGPFTLDSTFIVSPFSTGFHFIKDVPYAKATKLLSLLNNNGQIFGENDVRLGGHILAPPQQAAILPNIPLNSIPVDKRAASQHPITSSPNLTPGYTTKDDAGPDGDDTIHSPIPFYRVPNCIEAIINATNSVSDPEPVIDVVFIEFIQPWILLAFQFLGLEYSDADVAPYMYGENLTSLLAKWVQGNWKGKC